MAYQKIKDTSTGKEWIFDFESTPSEEQFYSNIANIIKEIENYPTRIVVDSSYGKCEYSAISRGSVKRDGKEFPAPHLTEVFNDVYGLNVSNPVEKYLVCINPESNNYKYYWLKENGYIEDSCDVKEPRVINSSIWHGQYGSICDGRESDNRGIYGTRVVKNPYPKSMYYIKIGEELCKGYVDFNDIKFVEDKKKKQVKSKDKTCEIDESSASYKLYQTLLTYSKEVVKRNLSNKSVNKKQVREARKCFNEMLKKSTVKGFNRWLEKLLILAPRQRDRYISSWLATSTLDFENIVKREESILNSMEAMLLDENVKECKASNPFEDIEIYEATDKQIEEVKNHLNDSLKDKVLNVYRVIPSKQKERFNKYVKDNNIKIIKQFWHGSGNENWISIINNSLLLNPNALITGKMFGNGIYFAPSPSKSWGYTSANGSYWRGGTSTKAFMGLYATAYGKPLMTTYNGYHYKESQVKGKGCDCVHATPQNTGLRNDEVIFYNESSVLLNYIVEFEC